MPELSVLIPVRNGGAHLILALESVRRARGVDFELVVVDHASTDETPRILEGFAATEPRLRVVAAPRELTLGGVLEVGRRACRAPLIARMDADDLMHPHRLRDDVAFLRARPDVSAVGCRVKLFGERTPGVGMRAYVRWQNAWLEPEEIARELFIEQPLCHPATTFRAAALDDVGGYRSGLFAEDYDLFLRLFARGHRLAKRPAVHHGWREHDFRATRTDPRYARDTFARLKARTLKEVFSLDARPVFIAGAGKEGGRIGRMLKDEGVVIARYFDIAERRIGRIRHGAPTLAADLLLDEKRQNPDAFAIGAVGTSGARGTVRAKLEWAGFVEGRDAVVVS